MTIDDDDDDGMSTLSHYGDMGSVPKTSQRHPNKHQNAWVGQATDFGSGQVASAWNSSHRDLDGISSTA